MYCFKTYEYNNLKTKELYKSNAKRLITNYNDSIINIIYMSFLAIIMKLAASCKCSFIHK